MARYSPDHKAKTRAHLLEVARSEFRENGFEAASIERLMRAAGLTRGGFYAHFASKEALVEEVLRLEPGLLGQVREVKPGPDAPSEVAAYLDAYLDPQRRSDLIQCPLVAHAVDSIRGGAQRAELYSAQVTEMVDELKRTLATQDTPREDAVLLTVLSVGAAILSSAVTDASLADEIENVCVNEIRSRLGLPSKEG